MTIGLVLSGGGSRGNFQVGAVRYLYERNIRPAIIAGTSVGAINAVKLAEGEGDGNDATRGLRGLIGIWRDLIVESDMWVKEGWFSNIEDSTIVNFIKDDAFRSKKIREDSFNLFLGTYGLVQVIRDYSGDINKLKSEIEKVLSAQSQSLYNLNPIRAKLISLSKLDPRKVSQSGIKLRMSVVALESGALRYVTEKGNLLERDSVYYVQSVPLHASACIPIATKIEELERSRNHLQAQLRIAPTNDKSSIIEQIRELNAEISHQNGLLSSCDRANPPQSLPLSISLSEGTLASASIPLAFSPVKLGTENYVDGGVREIVPIQAAIQAGATEIFAVMASDNSMDPPRGILSGNIIPSFDVGVANLIDVATRATSDIMSNEIAQNEIEPYIVNVNSNVNVTIIQPELDIHDIMTIDPGLIDIRMAYGYMRADDTYQAKQADPVNYRRLTEQYSRDRQTKLIYLTRYEIWKLEYAASGYKFTTKDGRPVHPAPRMEHSIDAIRQVRELKNRLSDLVRRRKEKGGYVPSEAENWWATWERHPWTPDRGLWLPNGPAAKGNDVRPGETLAYDQGIHSPSGDYSLVFQGDGNLVLYKIIKTNGPLAPECRPIDAEITRLQNALTNLQTELKKAPTNKKAEIMEQIQETKAIIAEKTVMLTACNKTYPPQVMITRNALWASGTAARAGACYMEHDGNLYIFDEGKKIVWFSNTGGNPGSYLVVQDDGNVVMLRPDGSVVWSLRG
ncbi:patatin-like phospholipase family protein [Paenibacillus sp. GSMTC-2017]|uniref:patatin-like phospholipase family protein n=1 Tax=Paenibacillus sp. GSMTC-2017 TaxID=2794350 RepID=UPI0018DA1EF5|nr:patatin-like phospholipase family protein [Paenibacillus sp. GSMTC-2017]MBH5320261.1 patatin-like phospholipase family protein [Paenibacillus sp. GSMTC-2017]